MSTLRILIYYGKYNNLYWLADTPTREKQALQALFNRLDEEEFFSTDNTDAALLQFARGGNSKAVKTVLDKHQSCEYGGWNFEDIKIPCNDLPDSVNLPSLLELEGFNAYQKAAHVTAVYPQHAGILYAALGLAGEGGEIAGKLISLIEDALHVAKHTGEVANQAKKVLRDDENVLTPERKQAIIKELGGMFWYAAEIATILGIDLATVPAINLSELYSRMGRGTLKGDGDDR